ncbi:MAG: 50S ribosomal protein L25 [Nitrospirae bacterium]|nr:50S ribosomal protein L25 [Nitrospirota bacterium]MBI3351655.1 50S ribosomal protein L25 [Nitrospirota bacterium]
MQKVDLTVQKREISGKGPARQLRFQGKIPAVLYSAGKSARIVLNPSDVKRVIHSKTGENTILNMKIEGEENQQDRLAIFKDFQKDPLTGAVLHVDLFEISIDKPLRVKVPLEMVGNPVGVKEGGILQHLIREVEIEGLPLAIPDHLKFDVSSLPIGGAVHVDEIPLVEGIQMLSEGRQVVVSVSAPISEEKLSALLESVPKETKEPEVIGKKKEEEGAAEGKGEAKGKKEEAKEEKKETKAKS